MIRSSMLTRRAVRAGSLFQLPQHLVPEDCSNHGIRRDSGLKAFLLAAGHGTRLRPLTDQTPKCLLPIGGKPILQIWLEKCREFGISQVLVNIHAHADMVREFLAHYHNGVDVQLVEEPELLGSAGTLL